MSPTGHAWIAIRAENLALGIRILAMFGGKKATRSEIMEAFGISRGKLDSAISSAMGGIAPLPIWVRAKAAPGDPRLRNSPMSPDAYKATLKELGWSGRHLSTRLGCHANLTIAWASGRVGVPRSVAVWLLRLVRQIAELPPPQEWRTRPENKPSI